MTSLLAVTTLGAVGNNIISVPLRLITEELHAPLSAGIFASGAFVLCMAVVTPVTGWLGDRWGMRRVLLWSLVVMTAGLCLAAVAGNIWTLVAARAVQGIACSGFPPLVMGMLVRLFTERRLRVMAAWAAANGIGQAIGPPVGGVIAELLHWRVIFVVLAVMTALALIGVRVSAPSLPGRPASIDARGAIMLCVGVGALLTAAMLTGLEQLAPWIAAVVAGAGVITVSLYGWDARRKASPFLQLRQVLERRFLRSTAAAVAQMFIITTMLIAAPLYLTGPAALSPAISGAALFALTFVMAVMAPFVARLCGRFAALRILRTGLVVVTLGALAIGLATLKAGPGALWAVIAALLLSGLGVALIQTPAAAGVTQSTAGAQGTGLGFFTMMRFAGSTAGAAWVAIAYTGGTMIPVATGAVVIAVAAFLVSFLGNPSRQDE